MPTEDDQVTLDLGGDAVDQVLLDLLRQKCGEADFTIYTVKEIKEKAGFVDSIAAPVTVELPVNGKPTLFDITDEVRQACRTLVPPIVDALHELIASFDPDFQHRLRGNVLLGGGGSQIRGLGKAIEDEMVRKLGSGSVKVVEEPIYAGANGALKIAHDMPEDYWKRLR